MTGGREIIGSGLCAVVVSACAETPVAAAGSASMRGEIGLPADPHGTPTPARHTIPPARGAVTVTGQIVAGGVECPMLQLETGGRAALQGANRLAVGSRVRVRGRWSDLSTCQQGRTIITDSVEVIQ
jgi:hypothetical protein